VLERVLVPLDGSGVAEAILPFAEELAGPLNAEIVLVRVIEPVVTGVGLATGDPGGADALLHAQLAAKRYLEDVAARLSARGLRVRTQAAFGTPSVKLAELATAEKADLIAMATHGRGGVGRLLFGSVAEALLRAATIPVLLFRTPEAPPPAGPPATP
jgi:nucleotide-binding universal stress UspA family protein